ncbi:delta(3,5)-Delta(2,4)-dienoyl-CoA isomerase, mitochondrial-like isoform X2 [Paramacrobiotus metropolitanus]|uniref:delta(3,5)-Delta(2,4)-dienoyl-CoA isomerase, mitochondrial-like isoform X2 n=1 Tax=Paramacrobiotus metropolitanus TaxID=2943436 RepID=UPI002445BAF6|nr:delta(3,5)-Delta(2,4)-dienoyl-CoA isomerase, mitochondrial-like isoform X2 [Paramacrobiotus metropolitanus]XP_055331867.1 delta(3,5)-Delta(2,4)-dienoyl-CoA isomerase, mitochondrial-like isoform X2 [Paramacrobiotus metropolitanus]
MAYRGVLRFAPHLQTGKDCFTAFTGNIRRHIATTSHRWNDGETTAVSYDFPTVKVDRIPDKAGLLHVQLNRPDRLNSLNPQAWKDIGECFDKIASDPEARVVVLSGNGKHFCAGLDLMDMGPLMELVGGDTEFARKALKMRETILKYQATLSAIEKCPKPVIAAVHGGCIGAGINMVAACDIRYCTEDAVFAIKEVDIGIAADVGVLQRMPKYTGNDSLLRELAFTARNFSAAEARKIGFLSKTFDSKEGMLNSAMDLAAVIARKSPIAIQGTKVHLNYSRDHTVQEGLESMANWNMAMLLSEDLMKSATASMDRSGKTIPKFENLL